MAKPALRRRIKREFVEVAQRGDGISLDIVAAAVRSGLVLNRELQEPHVSDDLADLALQGKLATPHVPIGSLSIAPCRKIELLPIDKCGADEEPEDRAPVIAAACFRRALCWNRRVHSFAPDPAVRACVPTRTTLGPSPVSERYSPCGHERSRRLA